MDVRYGKLSIIIEVDNLLIAEMEKVYLKQFDGATVKFVSNPEGDMLMISMSE